MHAHGSRHSPHTGYVIIQYLDTLQQCKGQFDIVMVRRFLMVAVHAFAILDHQFLEGECNLLTVIMRVL